MPFGMVHLSRPSPCLKQLDFENIEYFSKIVRCMYAILAY